MGGPKHQHFIPKSFQKQFAANAGEGRYLVDTVMKGSDEIETLPTSQVCVQKNIYTFPLDAAGDRFALEKQYAVEVDAVYPRAYEILINPSITKLSVEQKSIILNTTLSLYFRTPFFLNRENEKLDEEFDTISKTLTNPESTLDYHCEDGEKYELTSENIESVRSSLKIKNKTRFLEGHLEQWKTFVDYKMKCGIEVIEVPDDIPLISSDNPVLILQLNGAANPENIFDPQNIIEIALDRKHYLIIYPNETDENERLELRRGKRDKLFAAGVNLRTEEISDGRILGYPGDLAIHFKSQKELGEFTEENIKNLEDIRNRAMLLNDLMITATKSGSMFSVETINKVREIVNTGLMINDDSFKKIVSVFDAMGIRL